MKRSIIIAMVVVIVAIAIYFFYLRPSESIGTEFPNYFPKEMISDSYIVDLEVLNNAGKLDNEARRTSISYKSHQSIEDSIKGFKEYFTANVFTVENLPENEFAKFLGAQKDKTSISIAFWKESPVQISILYIVSK